MISKNQLKVLARSGSWQFLKDREAAAYKPGLEHVLSWKGHRVHYRPGSSDPEVIYKILLKGGRKADYWVPEEVAPKVIWDIGANIGSASIYLADRFPQAIIHAFEPMPANFALVQKNVAGLKVTPHNLALGAQDGEVEITASDYELNFGGFSLHYTGSVAAPTFKVPMATAASMIATGVPPPDLIKVDTEGAEWDILTAFPDDIMRNVKWIIGELHSVKSFALLEHLSQWFLIETRKGMKSPLFMFSAKNRNA